ncbi:MAG: hypothetical protein ACHQD9_04890 [Chitinophagales bacterium]
MKFSFASISILVILLLSSNSFAQPTQKDLLAKKWKYIGVEEFSVVHPPDSSKKNDWIQFNADGTYDWMQSGKKSSGSWKLNDAAKTISFTDSKTKKSFSYNLKNLTATDLTIEYQTPDLVRTRYRYVASGQ